MFKNYFLFNLILLIIINEINKISGCNMKYSRHCGGDGGCCNKHHQCCGKTYDVMVMVIDHVVVINFMIQINKNAVVIRLSTKIFIAAMAKVLAYKINGVIKETGVVIIAAIVEEEDLEFNNI
ncbi:hypothetical protein Mgra_00005582 [Meloidogyne graminicola]|uniref:Uncharacterized protein n=2 Tax=Meloidogyne graminicola TaxID=189291 RepID=A0A8S9ZNJ1_9BILA|nr:hypothetical protein Mgra_00005582 [Meloidogyne graminicola]